MQKTVSMHFSVAFVLLTRTGSSASAGSQMVPGFMSRWTHLSSLVIRSRKWHLSCACKTSRSYREYLIALLSNHHQENEEPIWNVGFSCGEKWLDGNAPSTQESWRTQRSFEQKVMAQLPRLAEFEHRYLQGGSAGVRSVTQIGTM
jgi:hypothetical protein